MPNFCVNRNSDHQGDHEVHDLDSRWGCLPAPRNRFGLGEHDSCAEALAVARLQFRTAKGCRWCAAACRGN